MIIICDNMQFYWNDGKSLYVVGNDFNVVFIFSINF